MPVFGVDRLGELHRALHVGEEHRHLLALAFERAARGEDLLDQMLRRVGAGLGGRGVLGATSQRLAAAVAELLCPWAFPATRGTGGGLRERRTALAAEPRVLRIFVAAGRAGHEITFRDDPSLLR